VELVTMPEFDSTEKVVEFLKEIQRIVRYLEISSGDMEKGSMRLEANISLREKDSQDLPKYKVELKNINSFRFLKKAMDSEIERQNNLLESQTPVIQETRGYVESTGRTISQRVKEEANDYRYFPEPDIPPIRIDSEEITRLKSQIPELPEEKRIRYKNQFGLPQNYIEILIEEKDKARYFEKAVSLIKEELAPKDIASLMINQNLDQKYEEPSLMVKKIYELMKKDFATDSQTKEAVEKVISNNPKAVKDYQSGKGEVIGYLIGQVQKELKGKGNPRLIQEMLKSSLFS
jgi:aspartyl-tRNA(Asn)/glutamyl-tRNA(Gln) amidotransferase subunit B